MDGRGSGPLPTGKLQEGVLPPIVSSLCSSAKEALLAWMAEMDTFELSQATVGDFGIILRRALHLAPGALGELAQRVDLSKFLSSGGPEEKGLSEVDLFPLPFVNWSVEDMMALYGPGGPGELSGCGPFWRRDSGSCEARLRKVRAWVWNMVVGLNFMFRGFTAQTEKTLETGEDLSRSQFVSLSRLYISADELIGEDREHLPSKDWDEILNARQLTYGGEVVAVAQELTLEQVLPGLPPPGIAASVDAVALASPELGELLLHPELSIKPRSEWPPTLKRAGMHIAWEEWQRLGVELVSRGICIPLQTSELIVHNGQYLLNGLFGVGKNKFIQSSRTGELVEVLRLIINLIPSNELQNPIEGDVGTLPHFAQWVALELGPMEALVWGSEDISCAFYVFSLPKAWAPWFVLDWPLPPRLWGGPEDAAPQYLALSVIPMGWLSAVGICQHVLRCLNQKPGVSLPGELELRKDRPVPVNQLHRTRAFFQQYIDNWDAGEVALLRDVLNRVPRGCELSQWQDAIQAGYQVWGVPRAPDKSSYGMLGKTLGAVVEGLRGRAWPGSDKIKDLISLSWHLLMKPVPTRKACAMLAGRWIFAFQFRRQVMTTLSDIWRVISGEVVPQNRGLRLLPELLCSLALLPLIAVDFRRESSPLVTASDASETGAGVCFSRTLSGAGKARLGLAARGVGAGRVCPLVLIESFGGISGARRALELLGVTPALHLHMETAEPACRVVRAAYPDAVALGDIREVTRESLERLRYKAPGVKFVLHVSGPPCQNVSGLNAGGTGIRGEKSKLVFELERIRRLIKQVWKGQQHHDLCEMVASLSAQDQQGYNEINAGLPVRICPSSYCWVRRPRLYWLTWALREAPGVSFVEEERWTNVKLSSRRMPLSRWLPRGHKQPVPNSVLCTMVRRVPKTKPPFKPAGIQACDKATLQRWKADQYCYPPYQYQLPYLVLTPRKVLVPPTSTMREVCMGFEKDYTLPCMLAADRHGPGYENERCSLIGNSFHVPTVAWLLSHALADWGCLFRPVSVAEISDPGIPFSLTDEGISEFHQPVTWARHVSEDGPTALVRYYMSLQSHRGGDVKLLGQHITSSMPVPRSLDPLEWVWKVCISTPWKYSGEHINAYEVRAYVLALRWRSRDARNLGSRFLHLVDSQVLLGIAVKGRTSSLRLRGPLAQANAYILAANFQPVLGHVRSHTNPADRPSRRKATLSGSPPVKVHSPRRDGRGRGN